MVRKTLKLEGSSSPKTSPTPSAVLTPDDQDTSVLKPPYGELSHGSGGGSGQQKGSLLVTDSALLST